MTLGELKDAGGVPSEYQIWFLEHEVSKTCRLYGVSEPHVVHCFMREGDGFLVVETCYHVRRLRFALNKMFPTLNLATG